MWIVKNFKLLEAPIGIQKSASSTRANRKRKNQHLDGRLGALWLEAHISCHTGWIHCLRFRFEHHRSTICHLSYDLTAKSRVLTWRAEVSYLARCNGRSCMIYYAQVQYYLTRLIHRKCVTNLPREMRSQSWTPAGEKKVGHRPEPGGGNELRTYGKSENSMMCYGRFIKDVPFLCDFFKSSLFRTKSSNFFRPCFWQYTCFFLPVTW